MDFATVGRCRSLGVAIVVISVALGGTAGIVVSVGAGGGDAYLDLATVGVSVGSVTVFIAGVTGAAGGNTHLIGGTIGDPVDTGAGRAGITPPIAVVAAIASGRAGIGGETIENIAAGKTSGVDGIGRAPGGRRIDSSGIVTLGDIAGERTADIKSIAILARVIGLISGGTAGWIGYPVAGGGGGANKVIIYKKT